MLVKHSKHLKGVIQLLQNLISENNFKHQDQWQQRQDETLTVTSFRESGASKDDDNKNFWGVDFSIQGHPLYVPQTLYQQAGYN